MKIRHVVTGLVSALALTAASQFAVAADIAVRAPQQRTVLTQVSAFNWTGFYLGVHGGYGTGSTDNNVAGLNSPDIDGGFAGGQIGYNWQAAGSPWVFGVEADASWSGIEGSANTTAAVRLSSEIDYFGTARGRVGYAWDRWMVYATGGVAWAKNDMNFRFTGLGTANGEETHVGYAVGGGFEWAFAPQWSAKVEYLYLGLGDEKYFGGPGLNVDLDVHTIKVGLNYRFGY